MAISLSSLIQTNQVRPPRILIHGVSGVGKTTFAADSKAPVFIQTEDGLGTINVPHFPLAHTWDEVLETLVVLYNEPHDYRTLVIDSVDWLEPLIWAKTCRANKWETIEDPGYGKGYIAALSYWREYIDAINALRNDRGMTVIQIAHTDIKRYESPDVDPYDRYVVKLHTKASALLQEHCDVVLFANYRVNYYVEAGKQKLPKSNRAVGGGERIVYTAERPAFHAKNRFNLPDTLPFGWETFAKAMPESMHQFLNPTI
jgi:hypothetical protein